MSPSPPPAILVKTLCPHCGKNSYPTTECLDAARAEERYRLLKLVEAEVRRRRERTKYMLVPCTEPGHLGYRIRRTDCLDCARGSMALFAPIDRFVLSLLGKR